MGFTYKVVVIFSLIISVQARLSCKQIRAFVDGHNARRLRLADGDIPNQPAASQMNYIIWDEELAAKAAKWASRNEFEHNPDRSIGSNRFTTGENIYWSASSDLTYKFNPKTALDSWFDEYKDYTYGPLTTQQFQSKKMIGHYTQMAWSDSIYLGCGVSKALKNGMINYYAVCNYGPADIHTFINLLLEFIWTLLKSQYEVIRAMIKTVFPPDPKSVKGDIVVISGTGHGMGREMALRFARLGATVICVDINEAGNEETALMIKQEKGSVFKYQCDVTNRGAVMQLADRIRREVGDVTILVNNAGIMPCKPVLEQTEQEIRLMNDLNVNAYIWMIQAFLPAMMQRNYGHIVSMSSMAGLLGIRNLVPYCGSKYAVKGIMDALAVELRDDKRELNGIKLTTVYPYIVNTGLCHKPRIRFDSLMKVVEPGEAADIILNAVRRDYKEVTIPQDLYYSNKFIFRLLPFHAACAWQDFIDAGVDAHD